MLKDRPAMVTGGEIENSWETFGAACRVAIDDSAETVLGLLGKGRGRLHLGGLSNVMQALIVELGSGCSTGVHRPVVSTSLRHENMA